MKTIFVNGVKVEILAEYNQADIVEGLEQLLRNHQYNVRTDWQSYRKVGKLWKNKKTS